MKGLIRVLMVIVGITIAFRVYKAMKSWVGDKLEAVFVWYLSEGEEEQESADPAEKIQVGGA